MRNCFFRKSTLGILISMLIYIMTAGSNLTAQNSLMPLPNGQVMDLTGCGTGSNITLPTTYNGPCNALDEASLESCFQYNCELIDEAYKGQYPKFCQQIVHDDRGNILFFIVDNNIYNKNGDCFENNLLGLWLLHDLGDDGINDINRFQGTFSIHPEISIVPVPQSNPNDCDLKFYIFYALRKYANAPSHWPIPPGKTAEYDVKHFVRMLTYTDENTIVMTPPQPILSEIIYPIGNPPSWGPYGLNCGITEYNEALGEYLYFINGGSYFVVFQITNNISDINISNAKIYFDANYTNSVSTIHFSELEICKPSNQNYYLVAYPTIHKEFVTFKINDDFSLIPGNTYGTFPYTNVNLITTGVFDYTYVVDNLTNPTGQWDHHFIGLEFTSNGDYLYMTQEGYSGLKCYDMQNDELYFWEPSNYNFSRSHIELGKNDVMYFANLTYLPPAVQPTNIVGNLVYLTNPETPGIVSGTYELNNNNLTSTSIILSGTYPIMSATTSYSHFDFSDQIDGFEFTDFYTTINKIFVLNDFPLNLNATEVWSPGCTNNPFQSDNGHVYLTSDVTIPMGKNIEIQDMIFHFPEGIHMYLEAGTSSENGAYLKLNNTVFTSLHNCGETEDFWGGIVLEGNDSPQGDINSSQEPVVYMINSSKIENAVTGILSEVGGIIYANDCDFENNIQAIKFEPFQNTLPSGILKRNISFFNNCDFTVDDNFLGLNLLTPADFTEHVYLEGVDGISFRECRFDNQQSVVYYQSENNIGINTSDAGFTVNCNCDIQLTPGQECPDQYKHSSTFTNLNVGVQVLDGSKAVKISNCEFLDNIVGVGITGLNYPVVTRNDFVIGATDILNNPNLDKQAVAIKTIESTGFQIEENDISLTHNPNPVYFTYGIIIQQSGSDNNEVYNNDFTDIEYGVNALDENRAPVLEFSGLQILCNEFLDLSDKDIAVELYLNFGSGKGIRAFQGNSDNNGISAGNCFTMNIGTPEGNIWNKSERVINYYCPCILNCTGCYFPYEATPYYVNPYLSDISNSCQSHLSQGYDYKMDPGIETATKSNYYVSKTAYYNLLYSYYQQLDGGNTPLVLQQIQSTWPQEAWDLRNDLMAMSPYVSQEALEEAALSCVMPDAMLLEVCLANPDATRSDEFLELLAEGISCPLPQYMVDMVQDNWDAVTSRTILENGLARYGAERDFYANALIRNARFQDEYTLADFKEWHEERASLSDYYAIAGLYIENNYFDTADMVLDDVLIDFELDDNQLIGHNNYVDYYEFMLSLHNYNKTIHDLDSLELISLQAIADEPLGFAKAKAKSILCFAYDVCEPYYGYVSDYQPKSARTNTQDPYKLISDYYNKLKVSPNPVKDHAIFEWELPLLESDARLIISDIMGIVIEEFAITLKQGNLIWDTQKTTNGVYLYEIVENEKQLTNGKLIISK